MSDLDYGGGTVPPATQQPIPAEGLHDAICYAVVDWGYVLDEFEGVAKGVCRAIRFFFELDEKMADGRPFVLSTYPIKIKYGDRAAFRKLLASWLPAKELPSKLTDFKPGSLRTRMASLDVEHRPKDDGTYSARIKGVMKPRPGATPMTVVNTTLPPWVKDAREKDNKAAAKYQEAEAGVPQSEEPQGGMDAIPYDEYGDKPGASETPF